MNPLIPNIRYAYIHPTVGGVCVSADKFYELQVKQNGIIDILSEKRPDIVSDFNKDPLKMQLDNASPHTGKNNIQKLNQECIDRNLNMFYELQCPKSPD